MIVTEDIQMTRAASDYKNDKDRSIQAVKLSLESIKGISLNPKSEANIISNIKNFEHLNPSLLALAIVFLSKLPSNYRDADIKDIPTTKIKAPVKDLLKSLFPAVNLNTKQGLALFADANRYILLVQHFKKS